MMSLKEVLCAVFLLTSAAKYVTSETASLSMTSPSSTPSTTPSIPGLGDRCEGVCRFPESEVCVNHTCVCKPPLTDISDHKYCVTEPGPVVNFSIDAVGKTTANISWGAPTTPGVIQEYHLFVVANGQCVQGIFLACQDAKSPSFNTRHTGCVPMSMFSPIDCHVNISFYLSLQPYTNYTFIISANNDLYYGHNTTLMAQTDIAAAHPPSDILATVQSSSAILVNWNKPDMDTGPTWYNVTVLEATGRQSSELTPIKTLRVDGYNTTSCQVTGLLPSWVYGFSVTAHTTAGGSETINTTKTVRTQPSVPGPVTNLTATALNSPLMGVELSWSCPDERKRNGRINNYTVHYTGDVSFTQMYGVYHPEDPCLERESVIIPVAPAVNYTFTVFANAEFRGTNATTVFRVDPSRMAFVLPSKVTINNQKPSTTFVAVSAVMGTLILGLCILLLVLIYKSRNRHDPKWKHYQINNAGRLD